MKAITICQPWAWAIMAGVKRVENRTWSTDYRGPLAIHAGRSRKWMHGAAELRAAGHDVPADEELTFGAIVGVVDLVDVVRFDPDQPNLPNVEDPYNLAGDPLATGPLCWILDDPHPLSEPIPSRGLYRLWDVELKGVKP